MSSTYRVDSALLAALLAHPDVVKLREHGESKAWCPAHDDKGGNPSLRISQKGVKCFSARCGFEGAARLAELWGIKRSRDAAGLLEGRYDAVYDYHAADGSLAFQVCRKVGKAGFLQRRPDLSKPGAWIYNLQGVKRVLYHLPDILTVPPHTRG